MQRSFVFAAAALGSIAAGLAFAGPEKVKLPESYRSDFVLYNAIDRPGPKTIRFLYVNKAADAAARPGEPLPLGTVIVAEDRKAKLDGEGRPARDAEGRMQATDEIAVILVMEKQQGWGAEYPEGRRNGEWEYRVFKPDGTPNAAAKLDGCFACHLSRVARDYTFTYFKNRQDRGN